jgi:hypothetical protein
MEAELIFKSMQVAQSLLVEADGTMAELVEDPEAVLVLKLAQQLALE